MAILRCVAVNFFIRRKITRQGDKHCILCMCFPPQQSVAFSWAVLGNALVVSLAFFFFFSKNLVEIVRFNSKTLSAVPVTQSISVLILLPVCHCWFYYLLSQFKSMEILGNACLLAICIGMNELAIIRRLRKILMSVILNQIILQKIFVSCLFILLHFKDHKQLLG